MQNRQLDFSMEFVQSEYTYDIMEAVLTKEIRACYGSCLNTNSSNLVSNLLIGP